jgi:hypothetical protein
MRDERASIGQMLGEFLREAAVLTVVFLPMDKFIRGDALTWGFIGAIVSLSGGLLIAGMTFERKREW